MSVEIMCPDDFTRIVLMAAKDAHLPSLLEKLEYLGTYGEHDTLCRLYVAREPLAFDFSLHCVEEDGSLPKWLDGGLIYHKHEDAWGVHT